MKNNNPDSTGRKTDLGLLLIYEQLKADYNELLFTYEQLLGKYNDLVEKSNTNSGGK